MLPEDISINNVIEIFSDFLEESETLEIIYNLKMGTILLTDVSNCHDRSDLLADRVTSPEALARYLLSLEAAYYYYPMDTVDPWETSEEIKAQVKRFLAPRLEKLPGSWWNEVDRFFTDIPASSPIRL